MHTSTLPPSAEVGAERSDRDPATSAADHFRAEVRAEAGRQHLSKKALADRVEMSPWAMRRRLNGASDFTLGEMIAVAHALDVDLADLLPPSSNPAA